MKNFAVIFDVNGTLADTEIVHAKAYAAVLAPHGISFTVENFTEHWSRHGKKLPEYLESIGRADLLPKVEEMLEEKQKIFQTNLVTDAALMPGAKELVQSLKGSGVTLGVESSGDGRNLELMLRHFGLTDLIDATVSKDSDLDEQKYGPKKDKSSRLKLLADLLGYAPSQCIVLGDAEKDIKGAKQAGMKVIAVPNQYTKGQDFSLADRIMESLEQVNLDILEGLAH